MNEEENKVVVGVFDRAVELLIDEKVRRAVGKYNKHPNQGTKEEVARAILRFEPFMGALQLVDLTMVKMSEKIKELEKNNQGESEEKSCSESVQSADQK